MAPPETAPRLSAPIAMTMGEPAGIGVEISLKTWNRRANYDLPPFYLIADPDHVRATAAHMAAISRLKSPKATPVIEIADPGEATAHFESGLPVLPQPLSETAVPGKLNKANAGAVINAIETAVRHVQTGRAAAVVTNPIQKSILHAAGFEHPGHTEFLATLCGGQTPVMMLSCPGLKVVPVTIHLPLKDAVASLTTELIVERATITAEALDRDLGFSPPRLAIAGLNPHAGEAGDLGNAEMEIIQPAIDQLRAKGIQVTGPMASDSMFHAAARSNYDVAICMYHDQALIPVKALGFEYGINLTLGLPIIRTSPDHGTALDIAGRGQANSLSLTSAVAYAGLIARHRGLVTVSAQEAANDLGAKRGR
ncbi:MAG: 4-hydroxythreonine-4-phosphate dehydrogenase PdxA [Rhodospirillaceae bacterium]|nr:4-hydroxythreonine-4-phosphate dehydrogenase PdxA [Rhodospirillaceae bacterium]MBT4043500.1 4-hydroxythreonine-4-phosphate dehydrogenase PdxA [Rhodospirillaceae bacterium]MBT4688612.1 4-hydroxythreonine-4-phosphate dehydrogenase PdxA [Rhodospirillaceae bacterium]MBT5083308.1 4-hydroxythreonine-4-phosphate dehydrogenase PdxA [Rhodospirillaceae bacterium]MBT5526200.1 4-hydroxythreonine-4-phosphate dehydrogenase PdxA [Rhodospirillaceae bacterium]